MQSAVLVPLRSKRAFVATVVPIRIDSILEWSIGWPAGDPKILLIASRGASGYSGLTDKSFKTFVSPEKY